jgi:major membrane immunogen (membrane-anchored lipoprotein)
MEKTMPDFAKIVAASDGAQVLFYKDHDDDGAPSLMQVTEKDGVTGSYEVSFTDDDSGYELRDAAFRKSGVEQADAIRHLMGKAVA